MMRGKLGLLGVAAVAIAAPAYGAPLTISASDQAEGASISARFADGRAAPPAASARLEGTLLVISFDER